jgi:IgA-specific serine endopeptidase
MPEPNDDAGDEANISWGSPDAPEKALLVELLQRARDERDELQGWLESERAERTRLEDEVRAARSSPKGRAGPRPSTPDRKAEQELKKLRSELKDLERDKAQHDAMRTKLRTEQERRARLEGDLKRERSRLKALEQRAGELDGARRDLADERRRREALEAESGRLKTSLEASERRRVEHERTARERRRRQEKEAEAKRLQQEKDAEAFRRQHEADVASLEEERRIRAALEEQVARLESRIGELEGAEKARRDIEAQLHEERAERERLRAEVDEFGSQLEEVERLAATYGELKTELATAHHKRELAEKELADLTTLSRWWQTELQRARAQSEAMALELQQLRPDGERDRRTKHRI